jgi:hypothetical protein
LSDFERMNLASKLTDGLFLRLFIGAFGIAGVGLLGDAIYTAWRMREFLQIAHGAKGEVTEIVWRRSASPNKSGSYRSYAYPRVGFRTDDGRAVSVLVLDNGSNPSNYRVEEPVAIRYDPANPNHAVIDSIDSEWFRPMPLCGIGGVLCLMGFGAAAWKGGTLWKTGGLAGGRTPLRR